MTGVEMQVVVVAWGIPLGMDAMLRPGSLLNSDCMWPSSAGGTVMGLLLSSDRLVLGMQGVYKQMVEAFRSLGVEAVPGPGSPFDPEVHEAIMREENDDLPDGTVLQEFRRGFRLGSQLLRAAMVQVLPYTSLSGCRRSCTIQRQN